MGRAVGDRPDFGRPSVDVGRYICELEADIPHACMACMAGGDVGVIVTSSEWHGFASFCCIVNLVHLL